MQLRIMLSSRIIKQFKVIGLPMIILLLSVTGCESILDDNYGDCSLGYRIKFKSDYNMNYADAFNHDIKSISLYAFDDEGNFVYQKNDMGSKLSNPNYVMDVDINPDNYNLVALGGIEDNKTFSVPILTPYKSTIKDFYCMMNAKSENYSRASDEKYMDTLLDPLFHAYIPKKESLSRAGIYDSTEVDFVRVTHSMHIVLQQMSGQSVNADDYLFYIEGKQGKVDYQNNPLSDGSMKYYAWKQYSASANIVGQATSDTTKNAAVAEISVGRLVKENKPMLTVIYKPTGNIVMAVPIVDFALLAKGARYESMPDQEYLDRMEEFNMVFFLDSGLRWMNTSIIINGWRVVLNNPELGK